jgi:ribose 5-phosphate isomerase B
MEILIASDHAGFTLKQELISKFPNIKWTDLGPATESSVDYPDFASKLCQQIKTSGQLGVLICGSGQGMAMRANKYLHIRAALCWNTEIAKLSREHNNANVLCLGSRFVSTDEAKAILNEFLNTTFAGGRHEARVQKMCSPV